MSRHYRRRNVISCGKCGENYDASGPNPRCPACGARLEDYEPGEARPVVRGFGRELEGPDLLGAQDAEPETAPVEDFLAAGFVFLAFVFIVAGVMTRSPVTLNIGLGTFALTGIAFGVFKLWQLVTGRRKTGKREGTYDAEAPSMMQLLFGRWFGDRWR
jgi:hypothetical protein